MFFFSAAPPVFPVPSAPPVSAPAGRGAMGNVGTRSQCCSGDQMGKEDDQDTGEVKGISDPPMGAPKGKGSKEGTEPNSQESSGVFERKRHKARTWVQDVPSDVRTFVASITKPAGKETTAKLGLDIDYAEESTAIPVVDVNGGLVGQWNDENPMKLIRSGDCIVAVNGISKDVPEMLKTCLNCGNLELLIVRGTTEEKGIEPVASGLLAAEGYYQQVEAKKISDANPSEQNQGKGNGKAPPQLEGPDADELARTLAKKRTLNWFVRG
ncbi:unnamed protein product [Effrenium voratum]|nr:unnamed protein product [Effrenium voratum]